MEDSLKVLGSWWFTWKKTQENMNRSKKMRSGRVKIQQEALIIFILF